MKPHLLVLSLLLASPALADEDRFIVVVHDENPREEITVDQLSQLFLKKVVSWDHGPRIEPVDLPERSDTRDHFSRSVHGRRTTSIKSYWQRMIFSGRGTPPPEVDDDEQVLTYVRSRPGAVGYVSAETPADDLQEVKVLEVVEEERTSAAGVNPFRAVRAATGS